MAVAPPSTHNSHLDPSNLRLHLTSRSSYGRKYRSTADPTFNPKEKSGEHITRSGSCYRHDPSAEEGTNFSPEQILHEIKDNKALQWPEKMRSRPNKQNKDLWCHFHNDHGHSTDNCGSLKRAIEALIKRGQLRKFVAHKEGQQQTSLAMEERKDREENAGTINTIFEGLAVRGSSGQARKAYARESGNFDVKRVLVDNGSSAEVLFYDAFKKMNILTDRLQKMDTPLYGFSNQPVAVKGIIALPVTIGTPSMQANFMLDFVVVKVPSAYNGILGLPTLNQLQAVVSTYHLKIKFPAEHDTGEVKGDQTIAPADMPGIDPENLYVDGSSAIDSSGAGIILISPEGFVVEYALCFGFQASNNEAEYEAIITGIKVAHALKVNSLSVHSDSQLVVNHVLGDYGTRDERMAQYL
ncbi:hypothetical protein RJ639_028343 [Escallonia herrerae]|uniref:RNase H type-1 domain-containing protein n=1 Tax=Escallonia herrerae TaxID=1293975 RepID=A0AA88X2J7_9ASTE|nr:hypothetical protein RJ639_028343 [Escallonia herrerae]